MMAGSGGCAIRRRWPATAGVTGPRPDAGATTTSQGMPSIFNSIFPVVAGSVAGWSNRYAGMGECVIRSRIVFDEGEQVIS